MTLVSRPNRALDDMARAIRCSVVSLVLKGFSLNLPRSRFRSMTPLLTLVRTIGDANRAGSTWRVLFVALTCFDKRRGVEMGTRDR